MLEALAGVEAPMAVVAIVVLLGLFVSIRYLLRRRVVLTQRSSRGAAASDVSASTKRAENLSSTLHVAKDDDDGDSGKPVTRRIRRHA
ncbi:hypothetical protein HaLaN_02820 [Haematococcus lacustris]|uniref:Uncharacterized protein n=1 Tax=Haematococcus lacustris TaxID=44745 RepID=A0A699YM06_HAELA|nr:hypothetical protein HaLaN_02820 [Haematococcus lacustris]